MSLLCSGRHLAVQYSITKCKKQVISHFFSGFHQENIWGSLIHKGNHPDVLVTQTIYVKAPRAAAPRGVRSLARFCKLLHMDLSELFCISCPLSQRIDFPYVSKILDPYLELFSLPQRSFTPEMCQISFHKSMKKTSD